jgi:hypothetical protein
VTLYTTPRRAAVPSPATASAFASHNVSFDQLAEQTPLQRRAFELLDLNPSRL